MVRGTDGVLLVPRVGPAPLLAGFNNLHKPPELQAADEQRAAGAEGTPKPKLKPKPKPKPKPKNKDPNEPAGIHSFDFFLCS